MHRLRGRTNEFDLATFADFCEVRVLGEKAVTRMNGVDIADLGRAHDTIDLQITFIAWRRADADRFVCQLDMKRIDIRLRINCKRADAQFLASADDAQCNFTAISNQDFLEHVPLPRICGPHQLSDTEKRLAEL